jgi:hypothetical protein
VSFSQGATKEDDMSDETRANTDIDDEEVLDGDRAGGWAGVPEALGGSETLDETANRPAGPDFGASPMDDETPGSQGEIESGSEGDFGVPAPADDDRV